MEQTLHLEIRLQNISSESWGKGIEIRKEISMCDKKIRLRDSIFERSLFPRRISIFEYKVSFGVQIKNTLESHFEKDSLRGMREMPVMRFSSAIAEAHLFAAFSAFSSGKSFWSFNWGFSLEERTRMVLSSRKVKSKPCLHIYINCFVMHKSLVLPGCFISAIITFHFWYHSNSLIPNARNVIISPSRCISRGQ